MSTMCLSVPQMNSRGMPEVDRADQWLGVAVTSSGTPDGKALVRRSNMSTVNKR